MYSKTETRLIRESLEARQSELEEQVKRKLDEVRGDRVGFDSSNSTDGGDGALADASGALHHAEAERDMAELRDIAEAFKRIEDGTYGTCAACGEAIDLGRLAAWPTAKRCTACQRDLERQRGRPASL